MTPRKFFISEDDNKFAIMPDDIYSFRVKDVQACVASAEAKNPGAEGYNVTHEIIDSEDGKYDGRLFWNRFWFLPQNDWTWKRFLEALIPTQEWTGDIEIPDPYDLIGLKAKAHLIPSGYTDKNTNQWVEKNEVKNSEYYPYQAATSSTSAQSIDEPF